MTQNMSKTTTKWYKQKRIHVLEWPSQSPHLNPVAMLWQ
uniref:Tc1-like transposase DDE domain-containing protein n=1 Tax=Anguilla anguilla TaxID=7936 RepID=A0A0E9VN70_ANGAN